MKPKSERARAIERMQRFLMQRGMPRLQMSGIMILTGAAGLLASFAMLRLGLTEMGLRYPVAVLLAYGVFLGLLRLWLYYHTRPKPQPGTAHRSGSNWDVTDLADLSWSGSGSGGGNSGSGGFSGGGGAFGGSGAGGTFMVPPGAAPESGRALGSFGGTSSGGKGGSFNFELDDDIGKSLAPLLILALIALVLFLTFYAVYIAPTLFAEMLVDGALVTGLYRQMKRTEPGAWLKVAVRRTWWSFLIVAVLFSIIGFVMQDLHPEAQSLGDFWNWYWETR